MTEHHRTKLMNDRNQLSQLCSLCAVIRSIYISRVAQKFLCNKYLVAKQLRIGCKQQNSRICVAVALRVVLGANRLLQSSY